MTDLDKQIQGTLKPPKSFFDWCYSKIPNYKWTNKNRTILASNREGCPLIEKRLTAKSRLTFPTKINFFATVLVSKKRIEIQSYIFWSEVIDGKQTIEYEPTNFERFCEGKHIKANRCGSHWYAGLLRNYGYMSGPYTNTVFFPNEWEKKASKFREFKYLNLDYLDRFTLPKYFKYASEIEFLQSINANEFAKEIIAPKYTFVKDKWRKTIDMRVCNKKWLIKHKGLLKNSTKNFNEIAVENYLRDRKIKYVEGIGKYMNVEDFKLIPKRIGTVRFQNWVLKNEIDFFMYKDYLNMLEELEIEMNSDLVALPRDFKTKHDELSKTLTLIKKEKEIAELNKKLTVAQKYEMEINDLAFVAPKTLKDIVVEGSELSHCVGGEQYLENHKNGKSIIMFVRNKNDIEKPLYTLEYREGRIIQIQGKRNKPDAVPQEVRATANKWAERAKRA